MSAVVVSLFSQPWYVWWGLVIGAFLIKLTFIYMAVKG